MTNPNKLYPYCKEAACPQCGSWNVPAPYWHVKSSHRYLNGDFPFLHNCVGYAVDHLHCRCQACGFSYAMASLSVRSAEVGQ